MSAAFYRASAFRSLIWFQSHQFDDPYAFAPWRAFNFLPLRLSDSTKPYVGILYLKHPHLEQQHGTNFLKMII